MTNEEANEKLREYLFKGIVSDIFWADEAYMMAKRIGDYADQINSSGFGLLFRRLQEIISDRHTLSITKIFEARKRKYPIRSIPATLDLLEENAGLWTIPQPQELHKILLKCGYTNAELNEFDNKQLTLELVAYYRSEIPSLDRIDTCNLSLSLDTYFESRDKRVAHNEADDESNRKQPTWGSGNSLLGYAKQFVGTISYGYLNVTLGQVGTQYYLTSDASQVAHEIYRLLETAGIITGEA